jgi:hypothetical protein
MLGAQWAAPGACSVNFGLPAHAKAPHLVSTALTVARACPRYKRVLAIAPLRRKGARKGLPSSAWDILGCLLMPLVLCGCPWLSLF